jgi:nitroreductase
MATSITKAAVFRAIAQTRRSCKRFQPERKIPPESLKDILHSTIRAPSSFNLQPTQIIVVQNEDRKNNLAETAMIGPGNQFRTRQCSALAVFLADLEASKRISRIQELEKDWGQRDPTYSATMPLTTSFLIGEGHAATLLKSLAIRTMSELQPMPTAEPVETWAYKNTSLAVQSFTLAAASHDLATSIMEGFDARRAKEVLHIPDRYGIPMMVAVGYEYEDPTTSQSLTPRLDMQEVVFGDSFGSPLDLTSANHPISNATSA